MSDLFRSKIKAGDMISHTDVYGSIIGLLIKRISKGKYTHSAFYIGFQNMIEAAYKGVETHTIYEYGYDEAHYHRYKHDDGRIGFTKEEAERFVSALLSFEGTKYDRFQNFLDLLKGLFGWVFNFDNPNQVNCSELGIRALIKAGFPVRDKDGKQIDPDYGTPVDLANSPNFVRFVREW